MSEIKPVYQVQQLGEWIEVDKSIFDELYIQNKFPHRILYPAAAYEALSGKYHELKARSEIDARTVEALQKEVTHWKANHADLKERLHVATHRTDLPSDRLPLFDKMKAEIAALQKENAELKATISNLTKAYDRESNDGLKALEERDYWYDKADSLADKISECFDVPIGEHSNVNCPIVEAMKILTGEYVTKFDKESAAQAKRIAELEETNGLLQTQVHCLEMTLASKSGE